MPMNVNSSINSYLINMLYANSGVKRTGAVKSPYTDFNNLTSLRIGVNTAAENFQAQQASYKNQIAGFTSAVTDLKTRAQEFTGSNTVFDKKYVADTGNAVTGTATGSAKPAEYDINVQKLAVAQQNEGKSLDAHAFGGVGTGFYAVGLTVGDGQEKQLAVNIAATDTNQQALAKIADAVNRSNSGIKAEVKVANNKAYLSMEGQTGAGNTFTLRDISNSLVSNLNLSNKVKNAQDAVYAVNGQTQTSAANTVKLDNGNVSLTLKTVTVGTEKVTVGVDENNIVSAVRDLVATVNEINYNLKNADNVTQRGDKLLTAVQSLFSGARREEYQKLGITLNRQTGNFSLDETKLQEELKDNAGQAERLLSGSNGFAAVAGKSAKTALSLPVTTYLKAPQVSDYLNYGANLPLGNSRNFYNYSQGMFLDMMV